MAEPPVLRHKGRRFRRSSARARSVTKDAPHRTLPPPTPPSGKSRGNMHGTSSKESFPYQRYKPLPSIGQMEGGGENGKGIVSADSAVDLTTPSPTTSSTEVRGSFAAQADHDFKSDRKHLQDSRSSSRESRSATKTAKIEAKSPVTVATPEAKIKTMASTRRNTRGSSKSKSKSREKQPSEQIPPKNTDNNIAIPPEPPKDAPNTVTLKVRLPDGQCIQRRFNYQTCCLRDVVHCAMLVMDSKLVKVKENQLTLSNNCVPKVVYSDLSQTLEQVGLVHNTLLHLDIEQQLQ